MLRSRDLHRLYQQLDLLTKASLFMGSHGSYFSHLFSHLGVIVYICLYLCLIVSGLVASDLFSASDNSLRMPALPISTIINLLPLVVQKFTDGGFWEVLRVLKFELLFAAYAFSWNCGLLPELAATTKLAIGFMLYMLPPATAFFGFANRSLVASFVTSLETGRAAYIGTGRPPPFKRVPLHQLYTRFAKSHYEPFVGFVALMLLMLLLTRETGTLIRLGVLIGPMILWVLAPVLFMPHASFASLENLQHFLIPVSESDMLVVRRDPRLLDNKGKFITPEPGKADLSLMDWSALHEFEAFVESSWYLKLFRLTMDIVGMGALWLITPAIIKSTVIYFCLSWCWFALPTIPFFRFGALRPFLQLWLLVGLPTIYYVTMSTMYNMLPALDEVTRLLWASVLHLMLGRILYSAALLLADPVYKWQRISTTEDENQTRHNNNKLAWAAHVQIMHILTLQFLATSMTAIIVLAFQSVCVCIFAALDTLGGLHSWYLFNQRTEHVRSDPLLAKGSKYRNDGREMWYHIKNYQRTNSRSTREGEQPEAVLKGVMECGRPASQARANSPISARPQRAQTSPVRQPNLYEAPTSGGRGTGRPSNHPRRRQ